MSKWEQHSEQCLEDSKDDYIKTCTCFDEDAYKLRLIKKIEGLEKDRYGADAPAFKGTAYARSHNMSYNSALEDIINIIKE